MNAWKLKAIQTGAIHTTDTVRYRSCSKPYEIKVWCVAATDGRHKVLVDTGIDGECLDWIKQNLSPSISQPPCMQTTTAVKEAVGWEPEDVDIIINTHLHYDHCGNNRHFPNAKIYVQRQECEAAFDPFSPQKHLYIGRFFNKKAVSYFRWNFIEGETQILPGVRCLPTPGHTPGHQSVFFHTADGTVCVAGDAVTTMQNLQQNAEMGVSVNSKQVLESLQKIRVRADFVIPGHEPSLRNGATTGFSII